MGNKDRINICKYSNCKHNHKINMDTESYIKGVDGLYHEDCHKEKTSLQLFNILWRENINQTVNLYDLNNTLKQLMSIKGMSADYLLFALRYVINNHYSLHYPAGFKYYVNRQEIKDAYKRKNRKVIPLSKFVAKEKKDDSPKFSIKQKPLGFGSILGG